MFVAILILALLFLASIMPSAQGIALFLAGLVAPLMTQLFKGNLSGRLALALSVVVSAVIAVAASFLVGDVHNWQELVKNAAVVFGVAQLVFQAITQKREATSN